MAAGWLPEEGATLRPRIIGRDWNGPGDTHVMECGLFILDDVAYQDAPTTLQVGGVSKPSDTDFSELERETIWKNTSMAAQSGEDGGRQRPLRCEVCPAAVHAPVRNMGKVQYRNRLLAGQVYCQREKVAVFLWERAIYGA